MQRGTQPGSRSCLFRSAVLLRFKPTNPVAGGSGQPSRTQCHAGSDAGDCGVLGGILPVPACSRCLPSYCPGAGEVLPEKPGGERDFCPMSRLQPGSPVRGHCHPHLQCWGRSTFQILGGVKALIKLSPKYRNKPVTACLPAWLFNSLPHSYLTIFRAAVPSN